MARRLGVLLALIAVSINLPLMTSEALSAPAKVIRERKLRVIPTTFLGLTTIESDDRALVRLFGLGYFVSGNIDVEGPESAEGIIGDRFYTNRRRDLTLHVVLGTDNLVWGIYLYPGLHFPSMANAADIKHAVSSRLDGIHGLSGGVAFGASPTDVMRHYGRPTEVTTGPYDERRKKVLPSSSRNVRTFTYMEDPAGMESLAMAHFIFQDDKLAAIMLYNGD